MLKIVFNNPTNRWYVYDVDKHPLGELIGKSVYLTFVDNTEKDGDLYRIDYLSVGHFLYTLQKSGIKYEITFE